MNKILKLGFLYYVTIAIAALAVAGGLVYKLYALNYFGLVITLLLAVVISIFILRKNRKPESNFEKQKIGFRHFSYWFLYLLSWFLLITSATTKTIVSPWEIIPNIFFVLFFILTINLITIVKKEPGARIFYLSSFFLLLFSLAAAVYKIGYGFDPFIHEASLNYIDQHGFVLPKSFYYFGYYSLAIIAHKIFFINIAFISKTLVPILAAILIPYSFSQFKLKNQNLALILLALAPFSLFIISTPQSLAYIFLILSLIWLLADPKNIYLSSLLALAAFITHPLAGLPALFFLILTLMIKTWPKRKRLISAIIFIINALAIPTAFLFSSQSISWIGFRSIIFNFNFRLFGQENFILNSGYFFSFFTILAIIIITIIGFKLNWNKNNLKNCLLISGSLLLSYILFLGFNFQSLIVYEQGGYTQRLLVLAAIFLLPGFYFGLDSIIEKIKNESKMVQTILTIIAVIGITASLYHSYPRIDNYHNSRGYSVSKNDLETVNFIEKSSQSDYLVLANQQVSAAALKSFGFNRYYNQNYFYPIPTGGPLYQYYLDMVYKSPKKETMVLAMDLLDVNEAYFVLNNYWWNFPKLLAESQLEADSWQRLDNNYIFYYKR